jgi:hypothetical protein
LGADLALTPLTQTGGPEALTPKTIEQKAIGVNYLDVMQRKGAVPILAHRGQAAGSHLGSGTLKPGCPGPLEVAFSQVGSLP